MAGIGSGNQISQTDQSHSGVYDSGNAQVNYAAPVFPSFPFGGGAGVQVAGMPLTHWLFMGAVALAGVWILKGGGNVK